MMEFYESSYRVAKKEHYCELCKKKINRGEKYSYECGKFDGDFFVRKLCLTCYDILNDYLCNDGYGEEEFSWWEVEDYVAEKFCHPCEHGCKNEDDCIYKEYSSCPIIEKYYAERRKDG